MSDDPNTGKAFVPPSEQNSGLPFAQGTAVDDIPAASETVNQSQIEAAQNQLLTTDPNNIGNLYSLYNYE